MPAPLQDKAASALIRAELLRRGMDRHDLARATGLDPESVTNVTSGNNRSQRGRALIEAALNQAFWTDPETFAARRLMRRRLGQDVAVLSLRELDALAANHIPASERRRPIRPRAALLCRLGLAFETAHSTQSSEQSQ